MAWAANPSRKQESLFTIPLIQMGARVYLPTLGRFLQNDPIEGGTLNPYVYAHDPVNLSDYLGLYICILQCTMSADVLQPAAPVQTHQPAATASYVQPVRSSGTIQRTRSPMVFNLPSPAMNTIFLASTSNKGIDISKYPSSVRPSFTRYEPPQSKGIVEKYGAPAGYSKKGALNALVQGCGKKAVDFYRSVFKDSKVHYVMVRPDNGQLLHASFELGAQQYMAMDADTHPEFDFTIGISLLIACKDQTEVDYYWDSLMADVGVTMVCGWLKDQFGVRWQVIPTRLGELMMDSDPEKSGRVFAAMQTMIKINIAELEAAYKGE